MSWGTARPIPGRRSWLASGRAQSQKRPPSGDGRSRAADTGPTSAIQSRTLSAKRQRCWDLGKAKRCSCRPCSTPSNDVRLGPAAPRGLGRTRQRFQLPVSNLNPQGLPAIHACADLPQESPDGTGLVQANMLVIQRTGERHAAALGQFVVTCDDNQVVRAVRRCRYRAAIR